MVLQAFEVVVEVLTGMRAQDLTNGCLPIKDAQLSGPPCCDVPTIDLQLCNFTHLDLLMILGAVNLLRYLWLTVWLIILPLLHQARA